VVEDISNISQAHRSTVQTRLHVLVSSVYVLYKVNFNACDKSKDVGDILVKFDEN